MFPWLNRTTLTHINKQWNLSTELFVIPMYLLKIYIVQFGIHFFFVCTKKPISWTSKICNSKTGYSAFWTSGVQPVWMWQIPPPHCSRSKLTYHRVWLIAPVIMWQSYKTRIVHKSHTLNCNSNILLSFIRTRSCSHNFSSYIKITWTAWHSS